MRPIDQNKDKLKKRSKTNQLAPSLAEAVINQLAKAEEDEQPTPKILKELAELVPTPLRNAQKTDKARSASSSSTSTQSSTTSSTSSSSNSSSSSASNESTASTHAGIQTVNKVGDQALSELLESIGLPSSVSETDLKGLLDDLTLQPTQQLTTNTPPCCNQQGFTFK